MLKEEIFQPIQLVMNNYTNESTTPSDDIMLSDWWKLHESEYPVLSKMAKDYLAVMSTSVPCEQFFSIAGKQITQT